MEEIPAEHVLNWDQTGIELVSCSSWTMEQEGSKRVELLGANNKRQISSTEDTMLEYITTIIVPYVEAIRHDLGKESAALVILYNLKGRLSIVSQISLMPTTFIYLPTPQTCCSQWIFCTSGMLTREYVKLSTDPSPPWSCLPLVELVLRQTFAIRDLRPYCQ